MESDSNADHAARIQRKILATMEKAIDRLNKTIHRGGRLDKLDEDRGTLERLATVYSTIGSATHLLAERGK